MHAYLLLMSLALGYSLPGPTSWTAVALSNPHLLRHYHRPLPTPHPQAAHYCWWWWGGRTSALSLGDSGVTERGVSRPLPSLAASAPPTAASFFFFFAGATINAELIKPQLIASAGERERERGRQGGREGVKEEKAAQLQHWRLPTCERSSAGRTCLPVMLPKPAEVSKASPFIYLFILVS